MQQKKTPVSLLLRLTGQTREVCNGVVSLEKLNCNKLDVFLPAQFTVVSEGAHHEWLEGQPESARGDCQLFLLPQSVLYRMEPEVSRIDVPTGTLRVFCF